MALERSPVRNRQRRGGSRLPRLLLALAAAGLTPAPAAAQEKFIKIGNLVDYNFGLITNLSANQSMARDICVYSAKATPGYNVRASGSGAGGAFTLTGAGSTLGYEVQWAALPGRTTGTILQPNVTLSGLTTNATQANCSSGPLASASLIVMLRATSLQAALSGTYTGTLTVIVSAE
ncbi:hypothetical protein OMW55_07825 [Sphingomonas sp. BN140010]|uniref:Uncharacterized protein n=1 Tax=Sphingomonas arvum TaxID=2992113 RepID=A0ABT3JG21_9SPHN|nr:hypothetical protein [Sphingomonas sp. BN140010]MCW3797710.1 hypothetical protein [Sphingomonas sp. BN140010]